MSGNEVVVGVKLTADGKGFVGEIKIGREEFEKLGKSGQKAGEDVAKGTKQATSEVERLAKAGRASAEELDASFKTLGIRSVKSLHDEISKVNAAYKNISSTGGMSSQEIARASSAAKAEVAKLNDEIEGVSRNSAGASQGLQSMAQRYIGIAALTTGVIGLTKALFDAGLVAQKLQSTLSFATGSASNAAQEYQFIRKSVNELGLDLNTSSMSFAKLAAAAQGTKIQGQGVRDIFTAISQASTVMGLSAEESNGALYAISQMISKGTVASEELRGQLGERLPGAFQIASRAMGVSTAELGKMLEQGEVISDELLPRFAAELSKTFEGSLPTATKTAQAEINRLSTAWTEFKREAADSAFMDVAIGAIKTLTAKVKGAADDIASAKQAYKRAGEDLGGSLLQGIGIALSKSPDILFSRMGKQMIAVAEASYRGTAAYAQDMLRSQTAAFGDEGDLATLEAQGRLSRGKIGGITPPTAEDKAFTEEWNKLYLSRVDQKDRAVEELGKAYTKELTTSIGSQERQLKLAADYNAKRAQIEEQFKPKAVTRAKESDFTKFTQEAAQREALLKAEAEGLAHLTANEAWAVKIEAELTAGTLKMSAADQASARARLEKIKALEGSNQLAEEERKARETHLKGLESETASIQKQIETTLYETSIIGKTKEEIALLQSQRGDHTIAIMEEQLATLDAAHACTAESEALREQIKVRKELKAVIESKAGQEAVEATAQAAKKANKELNRGLTDALMRGFESGKGFAKNFFDSLKNMAKTLVLRPVISFILNPISGAITTALGGMGIPGMANATDASSAGGVGSWLSAGSSLKTGYDTLSAGYTASMASAGEAAGYWASQAIGASQTTAEAMVTAGQNIGAAASYIGAGLAGIAIGSAIAGDKEVIGLNGTTTSAIGASAGAYIGTFILPGIGTAIGALAGGVLGGVFNAAFGMGSKEAGATTLAGNFSQSGFAGQYQTPWKQDGGWFRSDKSGTDYSPVSAEQSSAFNALVAGTQSVFDKLTTAAGDANRSLTDWTYSINQQVNTEEQQKQLMVDIANSMGAHLIPELSAFQAKGENLADTAVRLTDEFILTSKAADLLGKDVSTAFGAIGLASMKAREDFIGMMGGMAQMTATTQSYYTNFFSDEERHVNDLEAMGAQFAALGLSMPETRAGFRELVEAQGVSTESGRAMTASLLGLNGAFAAVVPATAAAADSIANLAAAALDSATQAASDAMSGVTLAVSAEKDRLTADYDAQVEQFTSQLDTVSDSVGKLQTLASSLKNTLDGMQIAGSDAAYRQAAQAQISAALATARSGGGLPLDGKLDSALQAVSKPSEQLFSSFTDYAIDFYRTANDIAALNDLTGEQLSADEATQAILKAQLSAITTTHNADMTRLDAIVSTAQSQLDALYGINSSVLSVADALAGFNGSVATAQAAHNADPISAIYQKYFGRNAEAGGMEYWRGTGLTGADLEYAISHNAAPADAAAMKLRGFAIGTSYVPYDMTARIHAGEEITPRPYVDAQKSSRDETNALLRRLAESNDELRKDLDAALLAIAKHTMRGADALEDSAQSGRPLQVQVVA